jgi:ankyrin repeat protein
LVRLLLDRGADPNLAVTRGSPIRRFNPQWALSDGLRGATALYIAASLLELDVMRLLRAAGARHSPAIPEGATPLLAAVGQEVERPLRPSDSDFVQRPPRPEEPALEAVRMLIEMGADVNHASSTGDTALHGCAVNGFPKIAEFLVSKGAHVNAKNRLGQTPLALARQPAVGEMLRRLGGTP